MVVINVYGFSSLYFHHPLKEFQILLILPSFNHLFSRPLALKIPLLKMLMLDEMRVEGESHVGLFDFFQF